MQIQCESLFLDGFQKLIPIVLFVLVLLFFSSTDAFAGIDPTDTGSSDGGEEPPECPVAADYELWPPNHKFVDIDIIGIDDGEGFLVTSIYSVEQDEPLNDLGDGNTCPDAVVDYQNNKVSVRAERTGNPNVPGDGRVYLVTFEGPVEGDMCIGQVRERAP